MLTYLDVSKKCHIVLKIFCAKFQLNSSSLSKKSNVGVSLTSHQQLQGKNTSVVIELIEVINPSDAINFEPLYGTKSFVQKNFV